MGAQESAYRRRTRIVAPRMITVADPKTAELKELWCSIYDELNLNREGEATCDEVEDILRRCHAQNALCDYIRHLLSGPTKNPLPKTQFVYMFSGFIKFTGPPDQVTYEECRDWLTGLRDAMRRKAESRMYEMNSVFRAMFEAMDTDGKRKIYVSDLNSYLGLCRDPFGLLRRFSLRDDDAKITLEEFMESIADYFAHNGPPRRCDIRDARRDLSSVALENRRRIMAHLKTAWTQSCGLFRTMRFSGYKCAG